jgi:hypothetical protein
VGRALVAVGQDADRFAPSFCGLVCSDKLWGGSSWEAFSLFVPLLAGEPAPASSLELASSSSDAESSIDATSDGEAEHQPVQINLELPRRSLLVTFTCNRCGKQQTLWELQVVPSAAKCQLFYIGLSYCCLQEEPHIVIYA